MALPKIISLFSGAGGLDLGFQRSGFPLTFAVDLSPAAIQTHRRNFKGTVSVAADLEELGPEGVLIHLDDLLEPGESIGVIGGPPCQGFSTLGKRDADDPRNELFLQFVRLADELRPSVVLMENVSGLLIMEGGKVRENLVGALEALGFSVAWRQVLSADYGVPQLRRRAVFVATAPGVEEFVFPPATHGPTAQRPYVTVEEAIGDLPALGPAECRTEFDGPARNEYQRQRRQGSKKLHNHEAARHSPGLVKAISFIPDGGNRRSIPDEYQPRSGFHNSYSRLASSKPAVAITSNLRKPSSARAVHPLQNRGLTVREGARLQSFDDCYVFEGSRTNQYLQVGNAVPPLLSKAMAEQIGRLLHGEPLLSEPRQLQLALT